MKSLSEYSPKNFCFSSLVFSSHSSFLIFLAIVTFLVFLIKKKHTTITITEIYNFNPVQNDEFSIERKEKEPLDEVTEPLTNDESVERSNATVAYSTAEPDLESITLPVTLP